jgi:hypothetical protein
MEWRSFGGKGRLQGWTEDHFEERKALGIECRSFGNNRRLQRWNDDSLEASKCGRDGRWTPFGDRLRLVWRQGKDSGMECSAQTKPNDLKPITREDPND